MQAKERIILPLDVSSENEALNMVKDLKDLVGVFKVGLELFNSLGPDIINSAKNAGAERVFFDSKLHDIPNTAAGAARAAVRMGVWMFNVHATGGSAMMRAASESARKEAQKLGIKPPMIIGVTMLTSINQHTLNEELEVPSAVESHVVHLARLAQDSGLDGVVASPHEIALIKKACGMDFLVVTPGVRPAWADANDQKRIMTPAEAVENGADYLVIGRAITAATNRREAAQKIIAEMEE